MLPLQICGGGEGDSHSGEKGQEVYWRWEVGEGGGVGDSQGGRKQEKLKSKIMEIKKKYKLN